MAMSLVEHFKNSRSAIQKAFIGDLLRASDILSTIPFSSVADLKVSGTRWSTLPTVSTRKINGSYTSSEGTLEEVEETLAIMGGEFTVDRIFDKTKNSKRESDLRWQGKMKAQAIALNYNYYLINGDLAVDPDGFEGLKKRVTNAPARYRIFLDSNGNGTGTSLKVLASTANENTFIDSLHDAMLYVRNATHIFMNETTLQGIGKALRRSGLLATTKDMFGRTFYEWDGIKLVDVGLKSDQATEIIPVNSTLSSDANSGEIYVVRMGSDDDDLMPIQLQGTGPEVYDPLHGNEMESKPAYLRRIDWATGLFSVSRRNIARISGFKMAAS